MAIAWRSTNWAKQSCSALFVWIWVPCVCCDTGLLGSCLRHCSFHFRKRAGMLQAAWIYNRPSQDLHNCIPSGDTNYDTCNNAIAPILHTECILCLLQTTVTIVGDVSLEPHARTTYWTTSSGRSYVQWMWRIQLVALKYTTHQGITKTFWSRGSHNKLFRTATCQQEGCKICSKVLNPNGSNAKSNINARFSDKTVSEGAVPKKGVPQPEGSQDIRFSKA